MKKIIIPVVALVLIFSGVKLYEKYLIYNLLECKAMAGSYLYDDIEYCFNDIPEENQTIEDKLTYARVCSNAVLRQQRYHCESKLSQWDMWWFEHLGQYTQSLTH